MMTTSDYLNFVRDERRPHQPADNKPLPYQRFSTENLPQDEQLDAWSNWFKPLFEITPPNKSIQFNATNEVWRIGGMTVSRVVSPPVCSVRAGTHVKRSGIDHWVITLCHYGRMRLHARERAVQASANIPFLWSMGEPSLCMHSQTERLQLILSRDAFYRLSPLLDGMAGIAFDSPLGHMLGDYIVTMQRRLPMLSECHVPQVMAATAAIITAAVDPARRHVEAATQSINAARRERVRRAVNEHLRSPSLTPDTLCRIAGVSRSNLYRLLEDAGGVARCIQSRRLAEAHVMLSNPHRRKPVTLIAEELCFSDPSGFSRAFRREFGYSPSEAAARAASGGMPVTKRQRT